jgi:16S rRNA (guanine(966)-N(2))-methyltransferase RsmD
MFSSLAAALSGARVLDLFAGSGALGIEALSRGADRAVFVERSQLALRAIRGNLDRTRLAERAEVVRADALSYAEAGSPGGRRFDLVFADPPYSATPDRVNALLEAVAAGLLEAGGTTVLTRRSGSSTPVIPVHWLVAKRLEYGDTVVLIFQEE